MNAEEMGPGCKEAIENVGIAPVGAKVLVKPDEYMKSYQGSIVIPETIKDRSQNAQMAGYVVALGKTAYQERDFGDGVLWCEPGDRVGFARYGGKQLKGLDGKLYRIFNCEDIVCHLSDKISFDDDSTY